MEGLEQRVRELETARDNQAETIRKLRERGSVMLDLGNGLFVYGTSLAMYRLRELIDA